ncbi:hypothetical protein PLICBS_003682 [Purpureocillium lilacinum]|uniref:uncharacterized protein n=1 Tax=Purpureocillium lilacinum TaxID=33203 RepID=UPI0020874B30|nr:hypothetical protein PLICBS_003682 [Purpureocillium lilacinum]
MAALERNKTYEYKPIEIDVYAHTIVKSSASPRSKKLFVSQYIYMLNDWFRPANISFTLRDSETVVDAKGVGLIDDGVLRAHHRGCGKDLNIYFGRPYRFGDHVNGALAPRNLSDTMVLPDGIFLQNTGTWASSPVAVQMTAVWLGLLHPVEDFCSEAGDRVDDTPATPLHCFEDFARCPSKNVMAFGDMSEGFTPGQIRRMHTLWNYFRANKTCPPAGHGSRPPSGPIVDNKRLWTLPTQDKAQEPYTVARRDDLFLEPRPWVVDFRRLMGRSSHDAVDKGPNHLAGRDTPPWPERLGLKRPLPRDVPEKAQAVAPVIKTSTTSATMTERENSPDNKGYKSMTCIGEYGGNGNGSDEECWWADDGTPVKPPS